MAVLNPGREVDRAIEKGARRASKRMLRRAKANVRRKIRQRSGDSAKSLMETVTRRGSARRVWIEVGSRPAPFYFRFLEHGRRGFILDVGKRRRKKNPPGKSVKIGGRHVRGRIRVGPIRARDMVRDAVTDSLADLDRLIAEEVAGATGRSLARTIRV